MVKSISAVRAALMAATFLAAVPALADSQSDILIRDNLDPAGDGSGNLDPVDINGIGQMTVDEGGGYVGLCTGTLINPRTVIFAGHCVNDAPANAYGAAGGGIPISFGFHSDNLPAIIDWLGFGADPNQLYKTNITNALYNVEQVWYDQRSTALGPDLNFLQADVALATLDTPARGIPTWALLFSPLTGPAHAKITGYGDYGNGTTGAVDLDFRRRAAENIVSVLGSLDDVDNILFGEPDGLPQSLYQLDFDDPKFGTAAASEYDFNIFGGPALTREGITGPGDSGGPLIIDAAFGKPVVAGVLSGGSTYFEDQPSSSYGSTSFYQPLFLFWDKIVANNPYKYVGNKAGIGDWTDPAHWVQKMDPAYTVLRNGQLANALPGTPAQGVTGNTVKFGEVCDGETCTPLSGAAPPAAGTGAGLVIPGGPGSTNFVPDNVVANPAAGVRARYYDVTLSAAGITTLGKSITIDRLTVDGPTILDVKSSGRLTVLGDFTQGLGWTNVDGTLKSGETLFVGGLLTGSGTLDPTYFTSIKSTIAPGGLLKTGTLTIKGDVILSSADSLLIDLNAAGGDKLAVKGDADNPGQLAVNGDVLVTAGPGKAPRYGQTFAVATAQGGVSGTFANVYSLLPGVLRAKLSYAPNEIDAIIKAASLADLLKSIGGAAKTALKFATALDALRDQSYDKLSGVFGAVDVMAGKQLAASLRGLAPTTASYARTSADRQRRIAVDLVADRLSDLGGRHAAVGLSLIGSPSSLMRLAANAPSRAIADRPAFLGLASAQAPRTIAQLPDGMSGFVAGGYALSGGGDVGAGGRYDGLRSWHFAMGLEQQLDASTVLGFSTGAGGGATGDRRSSDWARDAVRQAAVYGTRRLGGGAYVGGLMSAVFAQGDTGRRLDLGGTAYSLSASPGMRSVTMAAEAGVNLALGGSLTLTPRIGLRYAATHLARSRETGGDAALLIDKLDYGRTETRLGAKLAGSRSLGGGWSISPNIQADWVRNLSGGAPGLRARFAAASAYAIDLSGMAGARDWGEVRGGLQLGRGALTLGIVGEGSTDGALTDRTALATLGLAF